MRRIIVVTVVIFVVALISIRGWEHTLTAIPRINVECPKGTDAVLVLGQSHASNTGPKRHISWSKSRSFHVGDCHYLRDPMPGTADKGGSIWPQFADHLGKPVVIANMAISGSSISQWTATDKIKEVGDTLQSMSDAGYPNPLIVFMQGETDAAKGTDAETYLTELRKLHSAAPDSRWLIVRESICYEKQAKWKALDQARDALAADHPNVTVGPDLDHLPLALRQKDKCHLTAEGQEVLGQQIAEAATPILR